MIDDGIDWVKPMLIILRTSSMDDALITFRELIKDLKDKGYKKGYGDAWRDEDYRLEEARENDHELARDLD